MKMQLNIKGFIYATHYTKKSVAKKDGKLKEQNSW